MQEKFSGLHILCMGVLFHSRNMIPNIVIYRSIIVNREIIEIAFPLYFCLVHILFNYDSIPAARTLERKNCLRKQGLEFTGVNLYKI